jgi:DNA segregation ATPase FtsK/SpoIIIE-like protein
MDRKTRRGAAELSEWNTWDEPDPILTLFIEEATTVGKKVGKRHHEMVLEILREGRKFGMRVVQVSQSPKFDLIVGGIDARNLMAGGGSVIALRPGGSNDSRLTLDSTDIDIDLRALPPEPGFAAVVRRGKVLATVMRVANAKPDAADAARAVSVRVLAGRDELAAGANYLKRHDPAAFIPAQPAPSDATDAEEESPQQTAESDAMLLRLLAESEAG